ncbi:MAG: exosome complex RNA-binding protein Csl4 [Candidatus Thorarchaeota archaeon]|nr:exosome complex RNA-binding protein Csl4 [Candidatus Thorarchaeota archaeon]
MAEVKSGDIVVPGDRLCVIEELLPSYGTYEEDGVVYAATSGSVSIDLKNRSVQVLDHNGRTRLCLPVQGDALVGEVTDVFDQRAEVAIVKNNDEDIHSYAIGEVHISNVTRRYVKSMHDVLSPGDIVRAAAMNTYKLPIQLSLVGPEFGVILAKCRKCGNPLTLTSHNNLFCLRCENRETREVANDYGLRFGLEARPDLAVRRRQTYDRERPGAPPSGRGGRSHGQRESSQGFSRGRRGSGGSRRTGDRRR